MVVSLSSLSSLSSWPCPCLPCLPCPFGRVLVFLVFLVFLAVSLSSLSSLSFWSCPCLPCLPCLFGRVLVILVFSEEKTEDTKIFWGKTKGGYLREKQGDTRETRFLREKGALSEGKPAHTRRAYVQADGADEVADPPDAGRADLAPRSARGQMTVHLEEKGPQWRGWALGEGT